MGEKHGFTLIELLIVVAIIGILAAIAVPNFMNARMRAKITKVISDEKTVAMALEQYFLDWNSYTEDHDNNSSPRGLNRLTTPIPFINSLPMDPFPGPGDTGLENLTFEFGSGNASSTSKSWPNTAYLIICAGPDKVEQVSGNDSFPHGVEIRSFDISNGLQTGGDIVLMGGQWQRGTIMMDGRWIAK